MAFVVLLLFLLCIAAGLFLFLKPDRAIDIQKRFYEKINWRIEPISMEKEVRNTRIMGLFLVGAAIVITACFFIKMYLK
jgi:hypothetical protein